MSWNMDHAQFIPSQRDNVPFLQESLGRRRGFARDAVHLPLPGCRIEQGKVSAVQFRRQAEPTMHPSQAQHMVDMCVREQATHQTELVAR